MPTAKRNIPLDILEGLQPKPGSKLYLIRPIEDKDTIFHLVDKAKDSQFYFKVIKKENQKGQPSYLTEYIPKHKNVVMVSSAWSSASEVITAINEWLDILDEYNSIETIFDDPILKTNQERFIKQFSILDEDASYSSFDLDQQLFLDSYLSQAVEHLKSIQVGSSDDDSLKLKELEHEANDIRMGLTTTSKSEIINKLSRFWGKAQIFGLDLIKDILVKFMSDITMKLLGQ